MLLTEIVSAIAIGLDNSLPGNWVGGLEIPTELPVIVDFDPIAEGGNLNLEFGVYVTPSFNEFDLSKTRNNSQVDVVTGLKGKSGVLKTSFITVSICRPYSVKLDLKTVADLTPSSEWSLLRNCQDNLEKFLIHFSMEGASLDTIESDPPNESALQERVYLAIITLGYKTC